MADNLSQALPFQIRVLDGPLSSTPLMEGLPAGTIHLEGRTAAYRPFNYEREMRVKTTYYAGNPEGTQQVIGKRYLPMTINGMWKDRYLGDGVARQMEDLFEKLLDAGSSLEVTWGAGISEDNTATEGESHVRIGILSKFKSSPDRPQDIAWEATFEWRGKGVAQAPVVTTTSTVNPREGFNQVVADVQFAKEIHGAYVEGSLVPIPQVITDALSQAFTDIDSATDTILRFNSVVASTANFPGAQARALVAAVSLTVDAMGRLKDNALKLDPTRLLSPKDLATDFLLLKDQIFTMLGAADQGADSARQAADGIADQVVPEVLAEVVAPEGVDLRDLALQFYGDADSWWAIADFNDIDGSAVPPMPSGPGDTPPNPIRIPRIQAGPGSDLRQNC